MALKLDMSKAYDRIEWDFLQLIMVKLGFLRQWVERVMLCVSTVSYSFLINGQPTEPIVPQRGLRQGDPISPYLFLLCAEGFGCLLREAHDAGRFHGISICRGAPSVSHLFFADDSLLFTRASLDDAEVIKAILHTYEGLSGQKINIEKCEISFSHGVMNSTRECIRLFLGMTEVQKHDRYLGLPTLFDRSKKISFSGIRDRIWKNYMGGRNACYLVLEKRFLLNSLFTPFRVTR